jgi:hypothetical protein
VAVAVVRNVLAASPAADVHRLGGVRMTAILVDGLNSRCGSHCGTMYGVSAHCPCPDCHRTDDDAEWVDLGVVVDE